jgi:hypothetical protein
MADNLAGWRGADAAESGHETKDEANVRLAGLTTPGLGRGAA